MSLLERHYTADEIAEAWHVCPRTVQDLFRGEPGTVVLSNQKPGRRQRTIIRIPESVLARVTQKRQVR